jgi:hypothetical protein
MEQNQVGIQFVFWGWLLFLDFSGFPILEFVVVDAFNFTKFFLA